MPYQHRLQLSEFLLGFFVARLPRVLVGAQFEVMFAVSARSDGLLSNLDDQKNVARTGDHVLLRFGYPKRMAIQRKSGVRFAMAMLQINRVSSF